MVGVLLAGASGFLHLPVSALPEIDYPTIQVVTFYPGASPDVTATAITAPLERQFGQMPGLNQMTSTSSEGASLITLQFVLDLQIDVAEQEVQAAINAAGTYLPADLPNPPAYSKTNPADAPVLTLALTSKRCRSRPSRIRRHAAGAPDVDPRRRARTIGGPGNQWQIQVNRPRWRRGLSSRMRTAVTASGTNKVAAVRGACTIGANDQLLCRALTTGRW